MTSNVRPDNCSLHDDHTSTIVRDAGDEREVVLVIDRQAIHDWLVRNGHAEDEAAELVGRLHVQFE